MKTTITYVMFFFPVFFIKPESRPVVLNPVQQVEVKLDSLNHDIWKLNEILKNETL